MITFEVLGRFWHALHQIKALDLNFEWKKYEFCKNMDRAETKLFFSLALWMFYARTHNNIMQFKQIKNKPHLVPYKESTRLETGQNEWKAQFWLFSFILVQFVALWDPLKFVFEKKIILPYTWNINIML